MEYRLARTNEEKGYKIEKVYEMNGRLYADCKCACPRCGGQGEIPHFGHVDQGICFKCNGAKYFYNTFRAYTQDEREKMDAQYQAKQDKKKLEAEQQSEANKKIWMDKYGFGEYIFAVAGGNTYAIKDQLKEAGARFYQGIGWFFNESTVPAELDIPEGYFLYEAKFDSMFTWNCYSKTAYFAENALKEMEEDIAAIIRTNNKSTSKSEYFGKAGDRIRKEPATFVSVKNVSTEWGDYFLYTFQIGDNVFTWFTTAYIDDEIKPGDSILLSGTVKDHKEYNGIKQTQLNRCIVKKGE